MVMESAAAGKIVITVSLIAREVKARFVATVCVSRPAAKIAFRARPIATEDRAGLPRIGTAAVMAPAKGR